MKGYGKKSFTSQGSVGALSPSLFQTPATEYRHILATRPFQCQITLEDVFNEAVSPASAYKENRPPKAKLQANVPSLYGTPQSEEKQVRKPLQPLESLYRDLGLEANCPQEDIKSAYKRLAAIHHPDKGGVADSFRAIHRAYEVLRDPVKRQEYDEFGLRSPFSS